MAGEWVETTLGDVLTLQRGFDLPESERRTGPYTVIASTGPVGTHDEAMVRGPGVVIGRSGSLGGGQYIEADFWPLNTTLWVKDFKGNNPRFCYYLLKSLDLGYFNAGSGVPTLNRNHIHPLPIVAPSDPAEQRAIAHILGTLDDKIELNRRMNETLEAMARAIFKSWFVDFLPVRAKMAAKANDPSLHLPQVQTGTWYVYAIECKDGSLYIGQTEDLRQRWLQHIGGKGANWTKSHPPVRVPYWEKQLSREAAVERENWLKTGYGRKWLKREIAARTQTGDPVRAKAEGRLLAAPGAAQAGDPGLPKYIADLFPDSFEDSDLGEIPKGWKAMTLRDVLAEVVSGARPKGGAIKEGVPSVGAENVIGLGHYDFSKEKFVPRDFFLQLEKKAAVIKDGDVLLYKDGAQIGRKTYFDYQFPHSECAINEHVFILRAKQPELQRFTFFWLDQNWMTQEIISLNSNSAQPGINQVGVYSLPILKANERVINVYDRLVEPLMKRLFSNCIQSRTLAALRDTLLPKLISGELRVKDAERISGEVPT